MGRRLTKAMAGAALLGMAAAPAMGERITFPDAPWAGAAVQWERSTAWGLALWKPKPAKPSPASRQAGPSHVRQATPAILHSAAPVIPAMVAAVPKEVGVREEVLADLVRHVRFQPSGHGFGMSWEAPEENAHVLLGRLAEAVTHQAPALGAFIQHGTAGIRDQLEEIRLSHDPDLSCFPEERPVIGAGNPTPIGTPAVPEPGTAALLAVGLLGMALAMKRKSTPSA